MVSFDSLRHDYFGLSLDSLKSFRRLSEMSHEFKRAVSVNTVTWMSFYGLHTGLYPFTVGPTNNAMGDAAASRNGEYDWLSAKWDMPSSRFTDEVFSTIDRRLEATQPILIHAHYLSLHPRKNWAGAGFDYRSELKKLDVELGRILDGLEKRKILDRMLLIVTADHGEELGHERGYQGHGFDVVEGIAHVPLLVRFPGGESMVREELVSTVDVFPTILQALDVSCPLPTQGIPLTRAGSEDRVVFTSSAAPSPIYRTPKNLLFADNHAVYFRNWKLIFNRGDNVFALFDLAQDPQEQRNLIDSRPELAKELKRLILRYLSGAPPATYTGSALFLRRD
jgi:arylsulfatase A-like enzyme